MNKGEDNDFLSRWSKRKRAADVVEPAPEARDPELEARAALEEKSDAEILEELGLPDPDTLDEGSDFKAFMSKAVPERLRTRALRKLWLTNPVLANLDELLDYGDDFTDAATVVENIQTAYRVGKGLLTDEEIAARDRIGLPVDPENEDQESAAEDKMAAAETSDLQEDLSDDDSGLALGEVSDPTEDQVQVTAPSPHVEAPSPAPPRRRMRFRVAET